MRKTEHSKEYEAIMAGVIPHYLSQGFQVDEGYSVETGDGRHNARDTINHWVDLRAIKTLNIELVRVCDFKCREMKSTIRKKTVEWNQRSPKTRAPLEDFLFEVRQKELKTQQQYTNSAASVLQEGRLELMRRYGTKARMPEVTQRLFVVNSEPEVVYHWFKGEASLRKGNFHFYFGGRELVRDGGQLKLDDHDFWSANGCRRHFSPAEKELEEKVDPYEGDPKGPRR